MTQLDDRALRPVGLRTTQLTLLQVLERSTRITSARLGALLAVDATTYRAPCDHSSAAGGSRRRERPIGVNESFT